MRPQCKVASAFLFVLAVVATPAEAVWALALYLICLVGLTALAGIGLRFVLRRLTVETPFLLFVVFLPFLGGGARIDVLGLSLSSEGLWGAWNIFAKATLGTWVTLLLASTTQVADLLRGLERLKVPRAITSVAGFMVRYGDVITGEMKRMRIARLSRGYDPSWIWQARAVASSAGTLFIRSFERGERVYLAMISRGFQGTLPAPPDEHGARYEWPVALALPGAAACVAAAAWASAF